MESHTHSARSCEFVVIPGTGDVFFAKNAPDVVPGHTLIKFDVAPVVHKFQVEAEAGLSFEAVFTVGPPPVGDPRLLRYANFISRHSPAYISGLVQTTVQSQITAAGLITLEDVKTPPFKQTILQRVEPRLSRFGLMVYHFDFDAALDVAYFSHLVSYTGQIQQNILFVKELRASDLTHQLSLPQEVFDHALGTFGATFEPGLGLTYAQGHLISKDKFKLDFNVTDDWGFSRELTCRIRKTGAYSKPVIVSKMWKQFVYDWDLKLGDFLIFYEPFPHLTVNYKIGVVRMARIP